MTVASASHTFDSMFPVSGVGPCDYYEGTAHCRADGYYHTIFFSSDGGRSDNNGNWIGEIGPKITGGLNNTIVNELNPLTDIMAVKVTDPVWSAGDFTETDVIVDGEDLPSDPRELIGVTWCEDDDGGGDAYWCDQHYIQIDGAAVSEYYPGAGMEYYQGAACHEMGHALGFMHGHETDPPIGDLHWAMHCMRAPLQPDPWMGSQQRHQINGTY